MNDFAEDSELEGRLRAGAKAAAAWDVIPWPGNACAFSDRVDSMKPALRKAEKAFPRLPPGSIPSHQPVRMRAVQEMQKSLRLLHTALADRPHDAEKLPRQASTALPDEPRIASLIQLYLELVGYQFTAKTLLLFLDAFQESEPLLYREIWQINAHLKCALLEKILRDATVLLDAADCEDVALRTLNCITSLRETTFIDWASILEPRILFDSILQQDPTNTFLRMDFESREHYRRKIAFLAGYSDFGETRVAQTALDLALLAENRPTEQPRMNLRRRQIGYYLFDEGFSALSVRIGYHPPLLWRVREKIRASADEFYIGSIVILTILFTALPLFPLAGYVHVWTDLLLGLALLIFPASQCAVEIVNTLVSAAFEPSPLPRLDFSSAVPPDCATLVAVPTLLLNPDQVRDLFLSLEVRYLANRDRNIHFALLTDLPDSVSKPNLRDNHPLVELAVELTDELNRKYAASNAGGFLLLHRHRIFNRRQGAWMGWERKRGKLIDLNKFLTREFDAFPIKAGNIEALKSVRYVLTLDSDSQLPRGSAASLIGAMAHPLNQAVVDPGTRIVKKGYGILQPRVSVTVHSAIRSRMASIFSGQTGLDIYTRAVSDTYQDLFGEGIFTGKGIYEIETLHAVLNRRFPRNALLSHDLIEGAYARAGLITDVELIDDYPSHYSAYSRRKHRWVRGDWQIVRWIFSRVPEESGRLVPNPISFVSRWKILDNLRRSLVDPFLFLFLLAGWTVLPGQPLYWTLLILTLLVIPPVLQFCVSVMRIALASTQTATIGEASSGLGRNLLITVLNLLLLPHQALLGVDAVLRSLVRGWITGERLLEWETAAQAETLSQRRTPVDMYMRWVPALALLLAIALWLNPSTRNAFFVALPLLLGWLLVRPLIHWLNRSPNEQRHRLKSSEIEMLRAHALRIWSYFDHYSSAEHHHLIPDNVDEDGFREAARVSPTNIGLLLNARQAACAFGFLTIPEFAERTLLTLATIDRLRKYRGHLLNWYDTRSCEPLEAAPFVSSVDSGNFVASLLTLAAGARSLLAAPFFSSNTFHPFAICRGLLKDDPEGRVFFENHPLPTNDTDAQSWLDWLFESSTALDSLTCDAASPLRARHRAVQQQVKDYLPWMLPEFLFLRERLGIRKDAGEHPALPAVLAQATAILAELEAMIATPRREEERVFVERCADATEKSIQRLTALIGSLKQIVEHAEALANATEFSFLVHPGRKVLSIGWDVSAGKLHESCYDMLASEARIATFLAVARGELPRQGWFRLARDHARAFGRFALMSWTGTMFEYLMPALWMRAWPNTLLARTQMACVRIQRRWARKHGVPWGVSESGFAERNASGDYGYFAWGVPEIALSWEAKSGPVVSPYSTFLALSIDPRAAIQNLKRLQSLGWSGRYGLYEAIDYQRSKRDPQPVRQWMAHHLGMSLLALLNLLHDGQVQEWFHANPLVQSAETLLNEKPARAAAFKEAHRVVSLRAQPDNAAI